MATALLALALTCAVQQLPGGEWKTTLDLPLLEPASVVGAAGDVDGDGVPDLLVDEEVRSGVDGAVLHYLVGQTMAAAGDIDQDGHADILVGDWPNARVSVISGATGAKLRVLSGSTGLPFGWAVCSAGDVDGDFVPDIVVGQPQWQGWIGMGDAFVYSGASGALLHHLTGSQLGQGDNFGFDVAGGKDLDGDGVPDVVVGEPGVNAGGRVWAFSGATGAPLWNVGGSVGGGDDFGNTVALIDDLDGDHRADVVAGARNEQVDAGAVYALGGDDGAVLWRTAGQPTDRLGFHLDAAGDVDGDGDPDVVAGCQVGVGAFAALLSGSDGRLVERIGAGELMGAGCAGDLDADGRDDLIVGRLDRFTVHAYDPWLRVSSHELSVGFQQSTVMILAFPPSEEGKRYRVLVSVGAQGNSVQLGGLSIPLRETPLLRRSLTGPIGQLVLGGTGVLGPGGIHPAIIQNPPALAAAIGAELRFAAVTFDEGPLLSPRLSSGAVGVRILP